MYMDKNAQDLLEVVIFIKDNMVTKDEHNELIAKFDHMEKKMEDGLLSLKSRIGAIDNRIDDESARRTNLENRVRLVLPDLPAAPERV